MRSSRDARNSCVALLLTVASASAKSGGGCKTDLDCSLNGVCRARACVCDPAWKGSRGICLVVAPQAPSFARRRDMRELQLFAGQPHERLPGHGRPQTRQPIKLGWWRLV